VKPASSILSRVKVLVLGGSVFVGRHLVDLLSGAGHEVAVLNRGRTASALPDGVEHVRADRTDAAQMRAALGHRDWDAVFDVSGFVMAAGGGDIAGLVELLDGRVGAYVFVSSIMAYEQSLAGWFPWTEDMPSSAEGPASYGGFKAFSEAAMLERHATTGFPAVVARPAAIYGPDNNIFDMEMPMFLRLLQRRPILVPHGGNVVGSYGHVDDLCDALVVMATRTEAHGQVFNVTGESLDVNRYVRVLAEVVDAEPDVCHVPDSMLPELTAPRASPVFSHLFRLRHHAMITNAKLERLLGWTPRHDTMSGHRHTYEWFRAGGFADLEGPLADPVWRSSWDFAAEAAAADRVRNG
jgi:nucleoside-diphosphate-sugar epimerase